MFPVLWNGDYGKWVIVTAFYNRKFWNLRAFRYIKFWTKVTQATSLSHSTSNSLCTIDYTMRFGPTQRCEKARINSSRRRQQLTTYHNCRISTSVMLWLLRCYSCEVSCASGSGTGLRFDRGWVWLNAVVLRLLPSPSDCLQLPCAARRPHHCLTRWQQQPCSWWRNDEDGDDVEVQQQQWRTSSWRNLRLIMQ